MAYLIQSIKDITDIHNLTNLTDYYRFINKEQYNQFDFDTCINSRDIIMEHYPIYEVIKQTNQPELLIMKTRHKGYIALALDGIPQNYTFQILYSQSRISLINYVYLNKSTKQNID